MEWGVGEENLPLTYIKHSAGHLHCILSLNPNNHSKYLMHFYDVNLYRWGGSQLRENNAPRGIRLLSSWPH